MDVEGRADTLFAPVDVDLEKRRDGTMVLRSNTPPRPAERCLGEWLERWAREAPDRVFLAERATASVPWATTTYAEALGRVRAIATWLLGQNLLAGAAGRDPQRQRRRARPAGARGHAHRRAGRGRLAGLLTDVGGPRQAQGHGHAVAAGPDLRRQCRPLRRGAGGDAPHDDATVVVGSATAEPPSGALPFQGMEARTNETAVARAFAEVGPETIAKFLFTSGSTGTPKAVINTQEMLTSTRRPRRRLGPSWSASRRSCWTRSLGAILSEAIKTSTSCSATPARSSSTPASRRRTCSAPRSRTFATSRRRSTSTCRAVNQHAGGRAEGRRGAPPKILRKRKNHLLCRGGSSTKSLGGAW